jgi:hypothetical protein
MNHPRSSDRWLEMDLTWFDPDEPFDARLDELFDRVAPLLRDVAGRGGVFFNLGWLIDLVTEWTGDLDQQIPTRSRRTARWAAVGYRRLAEFVAEFRAAGRRHGLGEVGCGILFVHWAHVVWPPELKIYDFDSDWYERHPELYGEAHSHIGMPDLHPANPLHADDYPYATAPTGLAEGASFPELFGAQWASFADAVGFDAILLRDGFCGPMIYNRNGPFGMSAPADPTVLERFSDGVRALFREVKRASPERLVVGYSSAISPVADWRVGCVDFESLVADGYIDAWIEQTWAGAWQDWWHQLWKGWTFQTANLLTRGAMITKANESRATACALWHLVETWDGWEHWDTLHQVPGKLTWGAWAFAHASALTPDGPRPSDGAYVSWLNNGDMELLSAGDVEFVRGLLDRTEASAAALERVHGPTLVYDRAAMAGITSDRPDQHVGEWIDDQAGLVMKWGVPILSCTRADWLTAGDVARRPLVAQVPDPSSAHPELLEAPVLAVFGRADAIAADVREVLGIRPTGETIAADFWVCTGQGEDVPPHDRPYLPAHSRVDTDADVAVHYRSRHTPIIATRDRRLWWQPTDWSEPFSPYLPKFQIGSTYPAHLVARLLNRALAECRSVYVDPPSYALPVAFHAWRSGGVDHVLLGNLESGEFGDGRTPRTAHVRLPVDELALGDAAAALELIDGEGPSRVALELSGGLLSASVELGPERAAVYRVVAAPADTGRFVERSRT